MAHTADRTVSKEHAVWNDRIGLIQIEAIPSQDSISRGALHLFSGPSLFYGSFRSEPPLAVPDPPIRNQEHAQMAELVQYSSFASTTDADWQVRHYRPRCWRPSLCRLDSLPPEIQILILGLAHDFATFVNFTQSTSRLMAVYNENQERLHAKVMLRALKEKGIDPHRPTDWLEISVWPQGTNKTIHDGGKPSLRFIPARAEFEERGLSLETTLQDIYYQIATNRPVSLSSSQCWLLGYIDQAVGWYTSTSYHGSYYGVEQLWCTGCFSIHIAPSNPDLFMTLCFGTRAADDLKLLKSQLQIRCEPFKDEVGVSPEEKWLQMQLNNSRRLCSLDCWID